MIEAPTYTIRPASEADAAQINEIVNYEIDVSVSNFNYGPRSLEDGLAWFKNTIAGGYPILVATTTVNDKEIVAGYSSLGSFRQKDGYRLCRGLGRRLLSDLLVEAKQRKFHAIIGSISEGNEASLYLAAQFGFRVVGTMKENGYKFDRWIDMTFVELIL
ncbi:hypothetical protein BGZ49_010340 [Haplosporangium sp. Z 27]|nr:hypothetical protein BGZ49_010340 [Haplosporangium sp. Z 27]